MNNLYISLDENELEQFEKDLSQLLYVDTDSEIFVKSDEEFFINLDK